jgi:hypothetical protein
MYLKATFLPRVISENDFSPENGSLFGIVGPSLTAILHLRLRSGGTGWEPCEVHWSCKMNTKESRLAGLSSANLSSNRVGQVIDLGREVGSYHAHQKKELLIY